jgi:hypothetical protein
MSGDKLLAGVLVSADAARLRGLWLLEYSFAFSPRGKLPIHQYIMIN